MSETVIGRNHPEDGQRWDAQCARCGSSLEFDSCDECGGDGFVEAGCVEDSCCCADPAIDHDYEPCNICVGECAFPRCLSSEPWCKANPLPGREAIEGGTPEWFVVPSERATRDGASQ